MIYLKTSKPVEEMSITELYKICLAEDVDLPKEIKDNINKLCEYQEEFIKDVIVNTLNEQADKLVNTGYKFKVAEFRQLCASLRVAYNKVIERQKK